MLPWDKEGDNLITYTEYPPGTIGYCRPPSGPPIIKVVRSNPTTPTWTEIASIPSPTDHGGHFQEQSQIVQLQDGTILMAIRNHQIDVNYFGLPILKSTDGGITWSFVSQLDTNPDSNGHQPNGRCNRGLWEPFLYVLPDGRVAGFYANEKHADDNPSYSQIISERISSDGGQTWGREIYAAAQPGSAESGARPGMPGFARMADGRYILVFECCRCDPTDPSCNIRYKISNDGTTWSNDLGTPIPDQVSGPFVCVLSTGRILVTSASTNQISISDDNGKRWYLNDPPAWNTNATGTWPAIYQTESGEVGVMVNLNGILQINFGTLFHNDQWSGPGVNDPNRPTQAAAGNPATMVTDRQQHMFYRDNTQQGAIRHVRLC
jgi:hypothetical protein